MTKTLKQVTDERMKAMRPKVEARVRKAASQAKDPGDMQEIDRLVRQIQEKESDLALEKLVTNLQLLNTPMPELQALVVRGIADQRADGDIRLAETLDAFILIVSAHQEGLGSAEGFMANGFLEAQIAELEEAKEILSRPPLGPELGEVLAKTAEEFGTAMGTMKAERGNIAHMQVLLNGRKNDIN